MKDRSIRRFFKVLAVIALLAGALGAAGPAQSQTKGQSWFMWSTPKNAEKLYVEPGRNHVKLNKKTSRTWSQYLFGEKYFPSEKVIYNRKQRVAHEIKRKRTAEATTAKALVERARRLTAPHDVMIMKQQFADRKRVINADTKHRMRLIELEAKSRRAMDAALAEEAIGGMTVAPEALEKKTIYNKPAQAAPSKVFTDYR